MQNSISSCWLLQDIMAVSQRVLLAQPLSGITFALKTSRYLGLVGFSLAAWCEGVKLLQEISLAIHRDMFSALIRCWTCATVWWHLIPWEFFLNRSYPGSEHSGNEMSQFVRKESDSVVGGPGWAPQMSSLLLRFHKPRGAGEPLLVPALCLKDEDRF